MEDFDGREERLKADMEVALERACGLFASGMDTHANRKFIAQKIIESVDVGKYTLSDLSDAGRKAVGLLNTLNPTGQGGGTLA